MFRAKGSVYFVFCRLCPTPPPAITQCWAPTGHISAKFVQQRVSVNDLIDLGLYLKDLVLCDSPFSGSKETWEQNKTGLKPNSGTYNFVEVSGHNLESSQT